jgi:flagellar motility protein MotE (MotC chaperone)
MLKQSLPGTVKGEKQNVKCRMSECSSSETFHVSHFTNNGLWMRAVGVGMSVIMAWSWVTGQRVHASAVQEPDPVSTAVGAGLPGSMATEYIKKAGSESSTTGGEPVQGPALTVPEEMVAMFQQRKQDLERRENSVREAEAKLAILKAEVEQILSQVEAAEQRRKQASPEKHTVDTRTQQLGQLAKMYESMPAEEAAERIERMTNRKALEILRLLKSKSAGAILAQVKVDRAAKLSEEFLTTP